MRSLLDTDEEESRPSEITLSTASLLGIFFGLVLVCGVFFGFGYSIGRGTQLGSQTNRADIDPVNTPPQAEEQKAAQTPAPAPPIQLEPQEDQPAEDVTPPAMPKPAAAPKERPSPDRPMTHELDTVEKAAVDSAPSLPAPAQPGGQPVVQIAAVAHEHDADVLVAALRQRGFGVVVRSSPQDNLWHVQVGPFADRNQAAAMKQKLLSAGYNAIIKQ